jgi:hypothetical protein
MRVFKKGDKVTYSKDFGIGDSYGLGIYEREELKKNKYLVVSKYGIMKTIAGPSYTAVWFVGSLYFWPPNWFRKLDTQLELDFNV